MEISKNFDNNYGIVDRIPTGGPQIFPKKIRIKSYKDVNIDDLEKISQLFTP